MMEYHWHEIRELSSLLEAEAEGREVDRTRAHHLASTLAEHHPEIRHSMLLIRDRMRGARR